MKETIRSEPVFESVSTIESRVAGEMQRRAIAGLLLSLVFIVGYIWFRFQKLAYGIAAVVALVHDVLITLAFIAVSHWLFKPFGFLLIEDFKVSLTTIAGFLTIIGYSLNDTIVVFDRIREVKGKSQNLTEQMINASVTQTLSRTLLTSSTTILAILLMYMFGGEGIHGFAYCLFVGIVVGTYSSIFIASPILVWFVQREQAAKLAGKVSSR
jgi:SecD/SecF fusion protein